LGDEQGGELLEHMGAASVIPRVRGDRTGDRNRGHLRKRASTAPAKAGQRECNRAASTGRRHRRESDVADAIMHSLGSRAQKRSPEE
jgi:hypothetical protein